MEGQRVQFNFPDPRVALGTGLTEVQTARGKIIKLTLYVTDAETSFRVACFTRDVKCLLTYIERQSKPFGVCA